MLKPLHISMKSVSASGSNDRHAVTVAEQRKARRAAADADAALERWRETSAGFRQGRAA